LAKAGRRSVNRRFAWRVIAQQAVAAYRTTLANGSSIHAA
jgi:hypothetical protein